MSCGAAAIREALRARLVAQAEDGPALIVPELRVGSRDVTYLVAQGPEEPVRYGKAKRRRKRPPVVRTPVIPSSFMGDGFGYDIEQRQANVDLALITPTALDLYEIKSESDSLTRLRTQIPAYDDTGTRNTLVIDERHMKRAEAVLPPHWGLMVANGDPCELAVVRAARLNPCRRPIGLLMPLYTYELLPLGDAYGARSKDRARFRLIDFLIDPARGLDIEMLTRWACCQIATRDHDSTFNPFGTELRKKVLLSTTVGDLGAWPTVTLSPFDTVMMAGRPVSAS